MQSINIDKKMKIKRTFFDELKEEDIKLVNIHSYSDNDSYTKNKANKIIYFSSSIFKGNNEIEKTIYKSIHTYKTGYSGDSNISNFCYNKDIYFPFSGCDIYIGYNRQFSKCFRTFHYYNMFGYGKILYHFGPTGVGKSICGRATIFNYLHFDKLKKDRKVFFPSIFFDIKILYKNWENKNILLNILKYELMNIFESFTEWQQNYKEYEKELNKLKPSSVFDIIDNLIQFFYLKKKSELLIILDHYSSYYDKTNQFENLKKKCIEQEKYIIYVIYEINSLEDQLVYLNFLNKITTVMNSKAYISDSYNFVNMCEKEVGIIYNDERRGNDAIKNIKEKINSNEDLIPFPENYKNYFDNNVMFYFKFLTIKKFDDNVDFENFVLNEKEEIKSRILYFIQSGDYLSNKKIFEILTNITVNINKEMNFDPFLFKYINSSYFTFDIIRGENGYENKFKYDYSFPLIKFIYEDIIKLYDNQYFIDIRDPEFMKLDGISMGVLFDKYMNRWFKLHCKLGFLEFSSDDIEAIDLKYLIKKIRKILI